MTAGSNIPEDIMDAVKLIRELRDKRYPTRDDRENLNRAKLRIAYWACRSESIVASRENLSYVLGSDALDIMKAYDKYLESDADRKKAAAERRKKRPGDKTQFWGGA